MEIYFFRILPEWLYNSQFTEEYYVQLISSPTFSLLLAVILL
jgi:hypothetical protein